MALSEISAAIRARNLITERHPAAVGISIPRLTSLIPTVLDIWARDLMRRPTYRSYFNQTWTVPLVNGEADLTDYFNGVSAKLDKASVMNAVVTLPDGTQPFTWAGNRAQLGFGRRMGSGAYAVYFDGTTLTVWENGGLSLVPEITLREVRGFPATVAAIPVVLEGLFVEALANAGMSREGAAAAAATV